MKDFPNPHCWMNHRVSYGETDTMGVLYYAEYLHIFERARSEFIRNYGMSYAEVEKRGIYLPVRNAQCRYRTPARYDYLLHVRVGLSKWGRASVQFIYDIWHDDKSILIAEGMTEHAIVNEEGKPCAVPLWLRTLWQ